MHRFLAFALILATTPALAWTAFEDDRLRYRLELPRGYTLSHETEQPNARFFYKAEGHIMAVWASRPDGESFEAEVAERLCADQDEGWESSYERFTAEWQAIRGPRLAKSAMSAPSIFAVSDQLIS